MGIKERSHRRMWEPQVNTGTWFKRSTLHDGNKQRPASSGSQKHKKRHKEGLKVDTSHLERESAEEREAERRLTRVVRLHG